MNELRVENIQAAYGKKEILRGISLSLKEGEITTLIGPNGAGKTTLLKVIAGFLSPINGKIWINGEEITNLFPHERVKMGISYFMQGGQVFPNLTVLENLEMGCLLLSSKNKGKEIEGILKVFPSLKDLINRRAGLLSGGQRQTLALAMVFVKQPQILLLDEPSSGLSPKLIQDILAKVHEINSAWHTTILLVEQNVREALNISHRAVAMLDGEIALETDQPQSWLSGGHLDQLFLGGKYEKNEFTKNEASY